MRYSVLLLTFLVGCATSVADDDSTSVAIIDAVCKSKESILNIAEADKVSDQDASKVLRFEISRNNCKKLPYLITIQLGELEHSYVDSKGRASKVIKSPESLGVFWYIVLEGKSRS